MPLALMCVASFGEKKSILFKYIFYQANKIAFIILQFKIMSSLL